MDIRTTARPRRSPMPTGGFTLIELLVVIAIIALGARGGTDGGWGAEVSNYRIFLKRSELNDPGPAKTFVFTDMRKDSIDMGNFGVNMAGFAPGDSQKYGFWDLPGFYHNQAGGFSFADGHSEMKRWLDARTTPPIKPGVG